MVSPLRSLIDASMDKLFNDPRSMQAFTIDKVISAIRCITVLSIGVPVLMVLSAVIGRVVHKHYTPQSAMLARKGIFHSGLILLMVIELHQMGSRRSGNSLPPSICLYRIGNGTVPNQDCQ